MARRVANYNDEIKMSAEQYCKAFGHQPRKFGDGVACRTCFIDMPDVAPKAEGRQRFVIRDGQAVEVTPEEMIAISKMRRVNSLTNTPPFDMDTYLESYSSPENFQ